MLENKLLPTITPIKSGIRDSLVKINQVASISTRATSINASGVSVNSK